LQRVEEKRTITPRIDCGFRPIEGGGASRRERVGQFLHPRFARQDAAQRFDLASFVDVEVTRGGHEVHFATETLDLNSRGGRLSGDPKRDDVRTLAHAVPVVDQLT
jgi:hypothetical protein